MALVKQEVNLNCCCCSSSYDLLSMTEPQNIFENTESCFEMIAKCFRIEYGNEIKDENSHTFMMCTQCVYRLKNVANLQSRIQLAYCHLKEFVEKLKHPKADDSFEDEIGSMKRVKNEPICCCCHNSEDLLSIFEPNNYEGKIEVYAAIITECFNIEFKNPIEEKFKNMFMICDVCIYNLRDAYELRHRIQTALKKNEGDFSSDNIKIEFDPFDVAPKNESSRDEIKTTGSGDGLKKILEVKKARLKWLTCDVCNKSFSNNGYLTKHMVVHSGMKMFECEVCSEPFLLKRYLDDHKIKMHSNRGNRNEFVCETCKKVFLKRSHLEKHKLMHSGTNFDCELCGESFACRSILNKHRLIHFGVKKTSCQVCGKIYDDVGPESRDGFVCDACKTHMMLHSSTSLKSQLEMFKCEVCSKSFPNGYFLAKHKAAHSMAAKVLACPFCDKVFFLRKNLEEHRRNAHRRNGKI